MDEMYVVKRDGDVQPMLFDKILHHIAQKINLQ